MKVLATVVSGVSHLHAVAPVAQALTRAGHEVTFVASESFLPAIKALGFAAIAGGFDRRGQTLPQILHGVFPGIGARSPKERAEWSAATVFAGFLAQAMVPDALIAIKRLAPDVLLRDDAELGGYVAADYAGLPQVSVEVGFARPGALYTSLDRLRATYELAPGVDRARLYPSLHLAMVAPGFVDAAEMPATTRYFREGRGGAAKGDAESLDWLDALPRSRKTVHVSLGTEFIAVDLLRAILEAVREMPVNVVMTVGEKVDPASFGPQPEHVHIVRYVPHDVLLPRCDAVVTHGGWGTIATCIEHGLPLLALPLGADQPKHAARCHALGIGRSLGPAERDVASLRSQIELLLHDPTYRSRVTELEAAYRALPPIDDGVALVEKVARREGVPDR